MENIEDWYTLETKPQARHKTTQPTYNTHTLEGGVPVAGIAGAAPADPALVRIRTSGCTALYLGVVAAGESSRVCVAGAAVGVGSP